MAYKVDYMANEIEKKVSIEKDENLLIEIYDILKDYPNGLEERKIISEMVFKRFDIKDGVIPAEKKEEVKEYGKVIQANLYVHANPLNPQKCLTCADDKFYLSDSFKLPKDLGNGIYDAETFMKLKIPEPDFQVQGLMLEKGITILGGYQSTFKTHTAIYIALCLTNGTKLFDRFECKKSNVLYVNEEMNASFFQKTIENIMKGCDFRTTKGFFIMNMQGWKIDKPEYNAKFLKYIEDNGIQLIIFDTFRECFVAAENSADEITKLLTDYVRPIIEKTGCSFLIILHKGKANAGNEGRQAVDTIRGSSMWRNSADSIILMDRTRKTERVELTHEKIRGTKEQDKLVIIWNFDNGIRPNVVSEEELDEILIDDCKKDLLDFVKKEDLTELKTGENTTIHKKFIDSKRYSQGTFYASIKELKEEGKIRQVKRGLYEVVEGRLNEY